MPCFPVHYIYLKIHVPECNKNGIQVSSWPQMENCSINLLSFLLFIKAVCSTQPCRRGTLWVSHLSKEGKDQNLDIWAHYHWDKTVQFLAGTLKQTQQISKIKDAIHPHVLFLAKQNYGFESCIEASHWQPKKQFFLLELSNNLPE